MSKLLPDWVVPLPLDWIELRFPHYDASNIELAYYKFHTGYDKVLWSGTCNRALIWLSALLCALKQTNNVNNLCKKLYT